MTGYHRVSAEHLAALATGLGGPAAVRELAAAQRSKRLLLLRYILEAGAGKVGPAAEALIAADRRDHGAFADLIGDPMVGAWLCGTVRKLVHDAGDPATHVAQVGALAAAAALRTGLDATVSTHTSDGRVTLPGAGTAMLGSDGPAVVTVTGGEVTVSGPSGPVRTAAGDHGWLPLRRLSAGYGGYAGTVAVEDGNPFRDGYHAPPAGRLRPDEVGQWQELFDATWALLARHLPVRAAELAAGLRALVPLAARGEDIARSGTVRDSFGALGLTLPPSVPDFAVTLVHEFQHSKLGGLLDLVPLTVPDGKERHFAPWRTDPRPTGGLLQGAYAFLGVADTWLALRAEPACERRATREFAVARLQVDAGLDALQASAELTARGREFTTGLRAASDLLMAEPVPRRVAADAAAELAGTRRAWQQRNPRVVR